MSGAGAVQVASRRQSAVGVTVYGDLNQIMGEEPVFRLERYVPRPETAPLEWARESPSRLLRARYETVDFTGREEELAGLTGWRDQPPGTLSVLLLHGPGGQGKTRLARRFAQHSAADGWHVWQARQNLDDDVLGVAGVPEPEPPAASGRGALVVVDYAERWPREHLTRLLYEPLFQTGGPVRLLLVARPAGVWWRSLRAWLENQLQVPTALLSLGPLGREIARRDLFDQARDTFAGILGVPGAADIEPPPGFADDDDFAQVLAVHMAALAAVDARHRHVRAPGDPAQVSAYLLERERAHWERLHTRRHEPMATSPRVMGRAVYTAALAGPLSWKDGVQLLTRTQIASTPEAADIVIADHDLCYPRGSEVQVLEPLYPDRLCEDFVVLNTPGHPLADQHPPDPWADKAVERLLATCDPHELPEWTSRTVTVLVAAAARWPHVRPTLNALLTQRPRLALTAGGATLTTLAELPGMDLQLLARIKDLATPRSLH